MDVYAVMPVQQEKTLLRFVPLFHPYAGEMAKTLETGGSERLLSLEAQQSTDPDAFDSAWGPNPAVVFPDLPGEIIEFGPRGAYSAYNWELFFHAPFLAATQLSKNQRFEEARRWFHFIFNPTEDSDDEEPARFWRTLPLHEAGRTQSVTELAKLLADPKTTSPVREDLVAQVDDWRSNPFDPHAIARWRPRAYQLAVVMRYVDNLLNWGDQLFRRDTLESLNEATQLYVLADQILGPRPERIPRRSQPEVHTYATLKPKLDGLSNALVEAEGVVPDTGSSLAGPSSTPLPTPYTLYFCVPHNERLLSYWDRVEDRLFKIRHCMNIEGRVRQLPLFEPPIDPALLVQAAAAGIDLADVLSDANAPPPHYRFSILAQKASELCAEVKSLGAALLSALEKRDSERLALLRSEQEVEVLEAVRVVRAQQVEEAKASLASLTKGLELARGRLDYYMRLASAIEAVGVPTRPAAGLAERLGPTLIEFAASLDWRVQGARAVLKAAEPVSDEARQALALLERAISVREDSPTDEAVKVPISRLERRQLDALKTSHDKQRRAMDYEALAQILALIPDLTFGVQGITSSPVFQMSIGGTLLSTAARLQASQFSYESSEHAYRANLHSILAGYERRAAEWIHQAQQAVTEMEQQSHQIVAATIRLASAEQELRNHDLQIENARAVDAYMREKYTNEELYDWLSGQLSTVYLTAYQLAYDVAKRAERAYRFELGARDATFIKFGYWDSLRKGLLAGERLHQDLRRMEVSYLDENRREHELTKHVSLAQLDPGALVRLKLTGTCEFEVPEALFDLDHPGHYMRRIKAVSLTVPSVTGPYTGVHATLTLLRSSTRTSPVASQSYARAEEEDLRFVDDPGPLHSIATSSGQTDGGLFEGNLRDERFLPCEGFGAISSWRLELPSEFRQFDYDTISDVILHLRYTARDGGKVLADAAVSSLRHQLNELMTSPSGESGFARLFSLRHEFSNWPRLLAESGDRTIELAIGDRFPLLFRDREITINEVELFVRGRKVADAREELTKATLNGDQLTRLGQWQGRDDVLHVRLEDVDWDPRAGNWQLSFAEVGSDKRQAVQDIWLVSRYTVRSLG